MATFDENAFQTFADSEALVESARPSKFDRSYISRVTRYYVPTSGATPQAGGPISFNGGRCEFNITSSSAASRFNLTESCLEITGYGSDVSLAAPPGSAYVGGAIDPTKTSIPFHPGCLFSQSQWSLSNASQLVDKQDGSYVSEGLTLQALITMTSAALESSGDIFYLPAVESVRDLSTGLSQESQDRAERNFVDAGNVKQFTKTVPLGYLFPSIAAMKSGSSMWCPFLQMSFQCRAADQILFSTAALAPTAKPRLWVTGLRLKMQEVTLSPAAQEWWIKEILPKPGENAKIVAQGSYVKCDAVSRPFSSGSNILDPGSKGVLAAILCFRSTDVSDGCGVNWLQFAPCTSALQNYGITGYQARLGSITTPTQPVSIGIAAYEESGSDLFSQYRDLSSRSHSRIFDTALQLSNMATSSQGGTALEGYWLACAQFFPLEGVYGKGPNSIDDLEFTTSSGHACTALLVRVRMCAWQEWSSGNLASVL
jgi:hypothetical protein